MRSFEKNIYGASCIMWMSFIYGFSAETGNVSGGKSMKIAAGIENLLRKMTGGSSSYDRNAIVFEISHIIRKSAHVAAFFILAMLFFLLVESITEEKKILSPVIFTVLCAAADEFHQSLVPGRGPSINDVGIDSCGALLGVMCAFLILSKVQKKNCFKTLPKGMII